MKKMYSLKTLSRKLQSFMAIMLVTLMAVSNVAAQMTWQKVTDVNDLSVGDKVVIVAASTDLYALGTEQNNNNRTGVAYTTDANGYLQLTDDIQVLELRAGTTTGTFAFYTGAGYLYAASSSSNYLRTQTTLNANSSWTITMTDEGEATVISQGTYTRNDMRYNPNTGQAKRLFACYASTSTLEKVSFYKEIPPAPATLPYFVNFDNATDPSLVINNGNAINKWMVGQAQGFDNNKLFISSSNGITNKYNISQASTVTASREIIIPAMGANISFDYRVNGEADKDYLKVELVREDGTVTLATLQGENEWTEFNYVIEPQYAGTATIVFTWINDNANGDQYPAAIDNISIVPALCVQINTLSVTADSVSANVQWTLTDSTQTNWEVQYKLKSHDDWYSMMVTTPAAMLTNLQGSSDYDVRVRAICGDNTSIWTEGEFRTLCHNTREEIVTAVEGTNPSNLLPFNNGSKYSWAEMLFNATQVGEAGAITALTFTCATPDISLTVDHLKIYMANTTNAAHASNNNWVPQSDLVLVYEGENVQLGGAATQTVTLNTPFNYLGENLAVVVSKGVASSANTNLKFNTTTVTDNVTLYRAAAGEATANYPANNSGLINGSLNKTLPATIFTKLACNDPVTCPDLSDFAVDNVAATAATLSWTSGNANQTNFLLQYKVADATEWIDVQVQDTIYTLTGLAHSTQYAVRVKAICGENDESNFTDVVTFVTPNPCPMVTNIAVSQISTTTTITWNAGGTETAWQVRFRPTTQEGANYVTINVSGIATTTIGGLPGNTEYEYGIKAICDDNDSYWAEGTFITGCAAKDFNYAQSFAVNANPECWNTTGFAFDGTAAVTEEAAWLTSPAMNVPATGDAFVVMDVQGGAFALKASYRGTAQNRFTTIYEGAASEEMQHIIFPIPEMYKDKAVNFAVVSTGELQVYNMEFNTCAYVPEELTVLKSYINSVDLQWLANGADNFNLEYSTDGTNWTSVDVTGTGDTVQYTLTGLTGNTQYQFRVRCLCSGNASDYYSNIATSITFCEPMQVPYTPDLSSMPTCWEVAYTGTNPQTTATVQNNALVMYNFGTSSQAQIDQVGDLYVILPSFDTTLNRLQLTFKAAKYNNTISSKFYLGVITDINDPSTFYQVNAYNLTSTEFTDNLYMLNQLDENYNHGYLAFRMKATDATAAQAVILRDVTVDFIPSCAKPMNLKIVDNSITANSVQLTWTQPTSTQNWDVKYGITGFDVETEGTQISANMRPRTVSGLTYGETYDFYVRAHCSNSNVSAWEGPVSAEIEVPYIVGQDHNITTCEATIYDDGGRNGDYTSNLNETMVINPIDPTTSVIRLQGNYNLENNYDFVYIYDGTNTNQPLVRTLTNSGTLDVTSQSGALTLVMTTDGSTVKSGFAFRVTCEPAPSCSAPKNLSFFNNTLSWANGVFGTPVSYEIRYRNTQTNVYQTTTSTTNSKSFTGFTVGDNYEFMVRSICGVGDTSEWASATIEIPCPLKDIPYSENFDSYSSTTAYASSVKAPDCWVAGKVGTSTSYYVSIYPTASYAHSTSNSLRFYNYIPKNNSTATYGDVYAILPAFNANLNQLALTGWIRRYSASASTATTLYKAAMTVGVTTSLTDPLNPSNFTEITTYNVKSSGTDYEHFDISLGNYSGPEGYLVLLSHVPKPADTTTYNYFCVDDLLVDYIPECGTPEISVTGTQLNINQTSSLITPQSYEILIGERVVNIGNVTEYDLATITGLSSNTEYTVKVRAVCSSTSNSDWSNEASFTTPCMAKEVPYTENFDSYLTQATATTAPSTSTTYPGAPAYPNHALPECWVFPGMSSTSSSYPQVFLTSGTSHSVSGNALYLKGYNKDTYAVLPAMDANLNTLKITFTYRNGGTNTNFGALSVGYMTDYNDPTTFVQVEAFTKTTTKTEKTVSFANVPASANNGYIVFKLAASATGTSNGASIDNVSVNYISCTETVTNLTAEVTNGTVTVTWEGSADAYDLEYGPAGFELGQGTRVTNLTTTDYIINAVSGGYDVYVRANCGEDAVGPWAHTTACGEYSLPYSEDFSRYVAAPTSNSSTLGELPPCYDYYYSGTTAGYVPKVCRSSSYSPYGSVANNPYLILVSGYSASYGGVDNPAHVTLPPFAVALNRLSVSLSARISSATNGKLYLGYVSNGEFTTLTEVTCATSGNATPVVRTYNLDQYTNIPADARLGFQLAYVSTTNSSVSVGIDDILIEELPFCVTPAIVSVTTATNSATVVISPSSNAQSYEVKMTSVDDGTVITGTANTTNYTATINGLSDNTAYIVTARAICSSTESSEWSQSVECRTKCLPLSLPYSENFNNYTAVTSYTAPSGYPDHVLPNCWSFLHMSANTSTYPQMFITSYSGYPVSGNCLFFKSSKDSSAYAILPAFNHPLSQTQITFTYRNEGTTTSNGTLYVGYMSDKNDTLTFTPLRECEQTTTLTPVNVKFNNTGITSSDYYIAFRYVGGTANNYYLSIDNVEVDVIPYCSAPEIASVTCTSNSADVLVNNDSDAQTYEVIAVPQGAAPSSYTGTPFVCDNNRHATVTGLSPMTKYDFYARIICDATTTSPWSLATTAKTLCAPMDLPYSTSFEDDGTLDKETFGASYPLTNCWNKINDKVGGTLVYPYSYSTTYSHTGARSLYIYNYTTTATTYTYEDLYAVLPEMNVDSVKKLRVRFYACESSTSANYVSHLQVGVMTDPNVASTFVKVKDIYPETTTHEEFEVLLNTYTGAGKYIAIKAPRPTTIPSGQTSCYNVTYVDDILVDFIPDCFDLKSVSMKSVSDNSAVVQIVDQNNVGSYAVEYRSADETEWQVVNTDTTVVTLSGLQPLTYYVVRAHTVCDSVHSGAYTEEISFLTKCLGGDDVIVGTGTSGSYSYGPYHNYYKNSWNESIYTSEEIGGGGVIRALSRKVVAASPFTMNTLKIYMGVTSSDQFQSTTDWVPMENLTLVYDGTNVEIGSKVGWETIELQTPFQYNGVDNLVIVTAKKASNYVSALTYEYTSLSNVYRNLYRNNDSDTSYAEAPTSSTTGTRSASRANVSFLLCPFDDDLAIDSISPVMDACDLSAATITVRVKNNSYVNSANGFVMTCQVNGAESTITEAVNRTLLPQESFLYTFNQAIPFVEGSNDVTVTALYDIDENNANNTIVLNDVRLVAPATLPYYQPFTSHINFGRDAWVNENANNNPNKWVQEGGMMKYYDNDTIDAQSYFITPCIEIPAGQIRISYDYNAMSLLPENMNVYMGTTQDLSSMTLIGQHQNFVKTDADQTYEYIFNNDVPGVYYIAVEALSQRGNVGITFDNLNIEPIVEVTVSVRPDVQGNANGSVSPAGVNYVVYGDDLSINIIPDEMYHVAGIWVDGERVMNEDQYNASFMLYTLEDITEAHSIEVFFKLEFHINKIAVNANPEYEVGGYFIPAEADTLLDPSAHTIYFAAEPHNHFYNMVVGYQPPVEGDYVYGDDVTADVVYNEANNTYSYTLDTLLVANYYVQAMFRKDTVNIHYTALAGDGVFDGQTVAHGNSYDSWVDYGNDLASTILPADGFYTMGVTVNGVDMGIIDHYDFDSVITTQYVTAQFGHKVTASIQNFNNAEYLGSNVVRGTIAPAEQMIVHGTSCSVAGTVQEHFHMSNFFVNGVDMLSAVTFDGRNFSYTIDSLVANTEINAVVRIDTVAIYYTVDAGNGYVNGNLMEAPAMDTLYIEYGSDFMSQFAAATGYHIVNVTVNGTAYGEVPSWLTEFITAPQYVTATFALNEYDITTAAHGNGSVSDGVHVVYDPQSSYTFTATPAEGYHISQILRNNESLVIADPEATYTETIAPVVNDYSYVAYFEPNIYTVTATCGANGTIDPYGAQSYEYGATPTFTVTANAGYAIEHVYVDGQEVTLTNGTYTFAALTANHTIRATFKADNYTITATAGANGAITPAGENVVLSGSTVVYNITPDTGYEIADVTVDNVSVGAVSTYTFENVAADHTINATFGALQFTITATAGTNGTITPAGVNTVAYGATPTYTVTANTGFEVDYVTVDGENVTLTNGAYTFAAVTANHEIFAAFKVKSYTITVTDPQNGMITPNGVITVNHGATPTFTVTPATGYDVTAITVNGSNVIADAQATVMGAYTYTFPAVTANRTLTATMTKKHYTITATAGANGTINGPATVNYGDNATYTITPATGYEIADVTVDGISVGPRASYTFVNVTANHTIAATFAEEFCVVPTALHTENVDSTSATLMWYHPGADSYDIQYKAATANTWTLVSNVPGFSYSLTNLAPNTYYMFQVRANCSTNNTSAWANAFSFKTLVGPSPAVGVADYVKSHVNVYAEHNRVHIINDYNVDIDNVSIYDMYGKLIYSGNAINNPEVIELNVAVGTYVVRLNTQQGPAVYKVHINR